VDPVPDPLLLRKSGRTGNLTRTSGSVARNSDHQTTEVVNAYYIQAGNKRADGCRRLNWGICSVQISA
jgi:hypothetical protein